ncbi:MAG: DUF6384 family protein [Planctomycetota bacterium]
MSSQQQQAPPPASASGQELSIAEMTRIMDVASTLRRERLLATRELSVGDTHRMLRERLLETARVTGDPVTAAEIDAAIEHYFQSLHEFQPPAPGFETFLARLYVARNQILAWSAVLGGGAALAWAFFGFAPTRPGAPAAPRLWGRW